MAWLRTQSRTDTTGKRLPHGRPSSGWALAGPGGALAAAEHVGAHDEPAVRVDGLARDRRGRPTTRRSGARARAGRRRGCRPVERVAHEDGVGRVGVERAPRLVGERDLGQHAAALEGERAGRSGRNCRCPTGSPSRQAPEAGQQGHVGAAEAGVGARGLASSPPRAPPRPSGWGGHHSAGRGSGHFVAPSPGPHPRTDLVRESTLGVRPRLPDPVTRATPDVGGDSTDDPRAPPSDLPRAMAAVRPSPRQLPPHVSAIASGRPT